MTQVDINQLLAQMRTMAAQAEGGAAPAGAGEGVEAADGADFSSLLRESIDRVNEVQQQAGQLAEAFETGDPSVDVAQVMVALQKASLSFQAMTQVRNKLVSAYQEIMNMQV
jgi:flagellar hook-basal body complex protein FliE